MQGEPPESLLATDLAERIGLAVRAAGYELEVVPRKEAADLGAARNGVVWATFHLGYEPKRPLFVRIGATVWGGARQDFSEALPYDDPRAAADGRVEGFVRERLGVACRRGLEQDPGHCDACPQGERHRAGRFAP